MILEVKSFEELTNKELYEILKMRSLIFMMEQNIHYLDLDDVDYKSLHFFIKDEAGKIKAYLRTFLNDDGDIQIGRVLTLEHGKGLGRKLLEESLDVLKSRFKGKKLVMDAQRQAVGFYENFSFKKVSDVFLEEGVEHIKMELYI